jgi:surface antigen
MAKATKAENALASIIQQMLEEKGVQTDIAEGLAKGGVGLGAGGLRIQKAAERQAKVETKRALNGWQKFVKAKKNQYKYKSGPRKGQINMKAMSRAFKKTPAGKKVKKK